MARKTLTSSKKKNNPVVAVVGLGRFGQVMLRLLGSDFNLILYNRSKERYKEIELKPYMKIAENAEDIYGADVVIYCVSIASFESVIRDHSKNFKNQLLVDTCSVKQHPAEVFKKYLKGKKACALLTHPMFGPDSSKDGFQGLPIVVDGAMCDQKEYQFWKEYFAGKGLNIVEMKAKEHDQLAANSQGVTHFIGRLLEQFGFKETVIDTMGAKRLQQVMENTCNDTWELFLNLQNYNHYTKKMMIDLGQAYEEIYNKLIMGYHDRDHIEIGIQGGVGSFNHEAILKYTKEHNIHNFKIKYLYTTDKVLRSLHVGSIDYGLFAVHNSVGGVVQETINAMADYKFEIVEEFDVLIRHFLMKRKDVGLKDIEQIMAHPQVLKQCRGTLAKKYPKMKLTSGKHDLIDTANAAKALSKGMIDKNTAILGPRGLSELFNLEIVGKDLQDNKENLTGFMLVKRK